MSFTFWYYTVTRLTSLLTYKKQKAIYLVTNLLPSYLMELKYYTTIYKKTIHHVYIQVPVIYFSVQKFIVKTFILYHLGKNTLIHWRCTIFINGTMEKEYVHLWYVCNNFLLSINMYVISHVCKIFFV